MVNLNISPAPSSRRSRRERIASLSMLSASDFWGLPMSTSGSRMGTRPAARIRSPTSNCWSTMSPMPAGSASLMTERHLGAEHPVLLAPGEQCFQSLYRPHHLDTVRFRREALVDLEERRHALDLPQVLGRVPSLYLAAKRVLEQDGAEHPVTSERGAGNDPGTHAVDQVEHLVDGRVGVLRYAEPAEGLGRAAAALGRAPL